jgi:hypothetical protein
LALIFEDLLGELAKGSALFRADCEVGITVRLRLPGVSTSVESMSALITAPCRPN